MKAQANYMPPEQFDQVLDAIPRLNIRKWKDEDIQMLFKICYWCALRFNEAIKLNVEDFDMVNREVWLGQTKTDPLARAPISPELVEDLTFFLIDRKGSLYPGLTYGTAIKWIQRLGVMLDIKAWTIPQSDTGEKTKTHIFRKSVGKDLVWGTHNNKKAPLNVVSQKLRHTGKNPLASTSQYLKLNIESVKDWEYENYSGNN